MPLPPPRQTSYGTFVYRAATPAPAAGRRIEVLQTFDNLNLRGMNPRVRGLIVQDPGGIYALEPATPMDRPELEMSLAALHEWHVGIGIPSGT